MRIFQGWKKTEKKEELCFPESNKYETVKTILSELKKTGSASFDMTKTEVSIILDDCGKYYMRVYKIDCCQENNGRPETTISDICYPIENPDGIDAANWKEYVHFRDRIELQLVSYNEPIQNFL